jgi:tetratricopeptide (TPR) repeat protein
MLWKKAGAMHSGAPANRIEALACLLQEDGGFEKLEAALAEFDPASLGDAERERWYHLRGIVPFRRGNRALAFERFGEAADQYPASGPIQFSLGQEYEFRGDPDRMLECFDRARFPGIPAEYALSQARYAYLWNRFDKGRAYIEPLLPIYFDLRILDTTFLYLRGLPFFEEV